MILDLGRAFWQLDLLRCRGAEPHSWTVEARMRRVISLFLPTWATDRLRRRNGGLPQPEVPLITATQTGNQRVIAAVDEAARRLGARVAVVDTPGCAWAMARFAKVESFAPGRASDVLAALPVEALRLNAKIVESLRDVVIERVAQLATKPHGSCRRVLARTSSCVWTRLWAQPPKCWSS
jgi:nucleotidyltransferase/DNA polymerase involved in DNA repair